MSGTMRLLSAFLLALLVHGGLLFMALPPDRTSPPGLPAADRITVSLTPGAATAGRDAPRRQTRQATPPPVRTASALKPAPAPKPPRRRAPEKARFTTVRPRQVKKRIRQQAAPGPSPRDDARNRTASGPAPAAGPGHDAALSAATTAGVRQARPLYRFNPPPDYPALARRRAWQGVVLVRARVLADGSVAAVSLARSCGHDLLDRSALEAVRGWRFEPGTRNGLPVETEVLVPIHFELQ